MEFCGEKQLMCSSCVNGICILGKCNAERLSIDKNSMGTGIVEKGEEKLIGRSPSFEKTKAEWPKSLCPGAEDILVNEDEAKELTGKAFEEVRKSNLSEALDKLSGKKSDEGKLRFSLLPWDALEKVVEVLEYGAEKYGEKNWQKTEDGYCRYIDAAYRHLKSIMRGFDFDDESDLLHIAHAAASLLFAVHFKCK